MQCRDKHSGPPQRYAALDHPLAQFRQHVFRAGARQRAARKPIDDGSNIFHHKCLRRSPRLVFKWMLSALSLLNDGSFCMPVPGPMYAPATRRNSLAELEARARYIAPGPHGWHTADPRRGLMDQGAPWWWQPVPPCAAEPAYRRPPRRRGRLVEPERRCCLGENNTEPRFRSSVLFREITWDFACVLRRRNGFIAARRALYNGSSFDGSGGCC